MRGKRLLYLAAALAFFGLAGHPALCAQGPAPPAAANGGKAAEAAARLKAIQQEEEIQAQRRADLQKSAAESSRDLSEMNEQLVSMAASERHLEEDDADLADQLAELNSSSAMQTKAWETAQKDYVTLWRALIRFAQTPDMTMLGASGSPLEAARGLQIMQNLLARLQKRSNQLQTQYADLIATQRALVQKRQNRQEQQKQLADRQIEMRHLIDERNQILAATTDEEKAVAAQLADLAKQAGSLQQLLAEITRRNQAAVPEQKINGLTLPIAGTIIQGFKQRDEYGVVSEGITLAGASKGVVVAPIGGKVVFAGPFRGYGNLVILDHGSGWHSLMAGFGQIDARLGSTVTAGEPLGLLPELAQNAKANLYFELRHGDDPVDPLTAASQGKVRVARSVSSHNRGQ